MLSLDYACKNGCHLFFILTTGHFFIAFWERGREGGRERERERERHWCERETLIGCLLIHAPTRDQTHNLGMCSDQESNPWPFWSTEWPEPPEPHWPRHGCHLLTMRNDSKDTTNTGRSIKEKDGENPGLGWCYRMIDVTLEYSRQENFVMYDFKFVLFKPFFVGYSDAFCPKLSLEYTQVPRLQKCYVRHDSRIQFPSWSL